MMTDARTRQQTLSLRASSFVAALALEQNRPEIALEIISNVGHRQNTLVRNIKAMAFARLKRFEDAYQELRSVLYEFNATDRSNSAKILPDVVGFIRSFPFCLFSSK